KTTVGVELRDDPEASETWRVLARFGPGEDDQVAGVGQPPAVPVDRAARLAPMSGQEASLADVADIVARAAAGARSDLVQPACDPSVRRDRLTLRLEQIRPRDPDCVGEPPQAIGADASSRAALQLREVGLGDASVPGEGSLREAPPSPMLPEGDSEGKGR